MVCQKCKAKTKVVDTVHAADEHGPLDMRQRRCPGCNRTFYTMESEIEYDKAMANMWNLFHRINRAEQKKV